MAHRHECLCSTSQLWLPHPALCVVLPECFWGLCVWSRAMGSKSGKLRNVADHDRDAVYAILLTSEWEEHICATSTPLQRLAEEVQAQQAHPSGSTILEHYKDFADVFPPPPSQSMIMP